MKKLILFLLCNLASAWLFAQTNAELLQKADEKALAIRQFRDEININTTGLLGGFYGMTYKRRLDEKRYVRTNEKRQLRFGLDFKVNANIADNKNTFITSVALPVGGTVSRTYGNVKKNSTQYYGVAVGYEIQKGLKQSITIFYGGDFGSSFIYNTGFDPSKSYFLRVGGVSFFGLRYYFLPYLSLGIETGAYIGYQYDATVFSDKNTYKSHSIVADYIPVRAFSINVGF